MTTKHPFVEELTKRRLAAVAAIEEPPIREAAVPEHQARTSPLMLEIRLKNGDGEMLSYSLLNRVKKRQAGAQWELMFAGCTVIVRGRNLHHLPEMLRYHKLSVLQEGDSIEGELAGYDKAFIESIAIEDESTTGESA